MEKHFIKKPVPDMSETLKAAQILMESCHARAWNNGWWLDIQTMRPKERNVGELLALIHSEVSEALEGHRKGLMDDKLPHHPMMPVELMDAVIRIFDMVGMLYSDAPFALVEKLAYNDSRADHKIENRAQDGGKKF